MSQNIFYQYFVWHFFDAPRELGKAWRNYLRFYFNFFSSGMLLKTFFTPWHGLLWSYGRGFSFSRYAETFISNSFSRIIGALIRSMLLVIGLVFEFFVFVIGGLIFLGWVFLPVLLLGAFVFGIKLLF